MEALLVLQPTDVHVTVMLTIMPMRYFLRVVCVLQIQLMYILVFVYLHLL